MHVTLAASEDLVGIGTDWLDSHDGPKSDLSTRARLHKLTSTCQALLGNIRWIVADTGR